MDKLLEKLLHERINPVKSLLQRDPGNTHRITISPDPEHEAKYIIDGVDEHEEPLLYKRVEQIKTGLESWAPNRYQVVLFPDPETPGRYTFEIIDLLEPIPVAFVAEDDGTDRPVEVNDGQGRIAANTAKSRRPSRPRD